MSMIIIAGRHKAERCNDRSQQAARYIADVGRRIDAYRSGVDSDTAIISAIC